MSATATATATPSTRKPRVTKAKAAAAAAAATATPQCISRGSGMTAGLEIWRIGTALHLFDRTPDNRFATDTATWSTATGGLNATALQYIKDAGATTVSSSSSSELPRENPASSRTHHTRT